MEVEDSLYTTSIQENDQFHKLPLNAKISSDGKSYSSVIHEIPETISWEHLQKFLPKECINSLSKVENFKQRCVYDEFTVRRAFQNDAGIDPRSSEGVFSPIFHSDPCDMEELKMQTDGEIVYPQGEKRQRK